MRIGIILGYVIAIVGLALIVAGAWDIYLLYTEQTFEITLSDYASPTRTIAGGIAMMHPDKPYLVPRASLVKARNPRQSEMIEQSAA